MENLPCNTEICFTQLPSCFRVNVASLVEKRGKQVCLARSKLTYPVLTVGTVVGTGINGSEYPHKRPFIARQQNKAGDLLELGQNEVSQKAVT